MVWSRATLAAVIRWAPIQISNRCGQTSTEVEAGRREARVETPGPATHHFLPTWAALAWSPGPGGSREDTPDLTWGPTGWGDRARGCRQHQGPGPCEDPGLGERGEVPAGPG